MTYDDENEKALECFEACCRKEPIDAFFLRKFFKTLISAHWENPKNHGRYSDLLSCYTLKSEANPNGVVTVKLSSDFDPKAPNPLPSIIVNLDGATTLEKKSIGNTVKSPNGYENFKERDEESKGWIASTRLTIAHKFEGADEAIIAATSTLEMFCGSQDIFLKKIGFSLFEPKGMTGAKMVDPQPTRYFQVDVVVELDYNLIMSVNIESPRIKTVETQIRPL